MTCSRTHWPLNALKNEIIRVQVQGKYIKWPPILAFLSVAIRLETMLKSSAAGSLQHKPLPDVYPFSIFVSLAKEELLNHVSKIAPANNEFTQVPAPACMSARLSLTKLQWHVLLTASLWCAAAVPWHHGSATHSSAHYEGWEWIVNWPLLLSNPAVKDILSAHFFI